MKRTHTTTPGPTLDARPGSVHRLPPDTAPTTGQPFPRGDPPAKVRSDVPLGAASAVGLVALVLLAGVVVVVQNSAAVELDLLWWSVDASLAILLVAAAAAGAALASTSVVLLRRRRRVVTSRSRS